MSFGRQQNQSTNNSIFRIVFYDLYSVKYVNHLQTTSTRLLRGLVLLRCWSYQRIFIMESERAPVMILVPIDQSNFKRNHINCYTPRSQLDKLLLFNSPSEFPEIKSNKIISKPLINYQHSIHRNDQYFQKWIDLILQQIGTSETPEMSYHNKKDFGNSLPIYLKLNQQTQSMHIR